jgi:hypothetical protein
VVLFFPSLILLMFLWVNRFQLSASDSEVSYRTLFGGTRRLQFSQIVSAKIEIGVGSLFGPFYRLVVKPNDGAPSMVINMKVFSRTDLQKLLAILHNKMTDDVRLSVFSKEDGT